MAPLAQLRTTSRSALLTWLAASAVGAVLCAAPARGQGQGPWGQAYNQATPSWGPRQAPQASPSPQQGTYQEAVSCTTPRQQPGHCIRLQGCKVLLDLLRTARISTRSAPNPEVTMLLRRSFCGFEGYSVKVCCPDPGATQPPAESEEPALVKPLSGPNRRPTARPTGRPAAAAGNVDFMLPASPQPTDAPYEFPAATDSRPAAAGGSGGNGGYVGSPSTSFAPSFGSGASAAAPSASSGSTPSASTAYPQPDPSMGEDLALSLGEPAPSPPDYPVENLALLPTEVCGLSMHREQHADRMVTNRTGIMRYPWMVRLAYKKDGERLEYLCSGSLISERYVLTAAHCLAVLNGPVSVRLGEWDTNNEPDCMDNVCAEHTVDVDVEQKVAHEDYRDGLNDIALLRLSKPVLFSKSVRPICLPVSGHNSPAEDPVGQSMLVASWGNTSPYHRQNAPSRWLLNYHVYVDAPRACGAGYNAFDDVHFDSDKHLCVAGGGCHGDSGSPLMLSKQVESDDYEDMAAQERDVLHGVLSYGVPDCAIRAAPLVFTRVSHYVPWLLRNLRPNPFVPKDELVSGSGNLNPRIIIGPSRPSPKQG